jgi:uncharacterized membrane protein YphA (DoxX/SURF4 family)
MALVLAVAAGLKIGGNAGAQTLLGSLPALVQWMVVGLELGIAAWLVSGALPRVSAFAALVLFSGFLAVILINMNSPNPRDCGCFGKLAMTGDVGKNLRIMLGIDAGLLGLGMAAYYMPVRRRAD